MFDDGIGKLLVLALDAVVGFSSVPLRLGTYLGLLVCALSLLMVLIVVIQQLVWDIDVPGYATLVTGMFFLGGVHHCADTAVATVSRLLDLFEGDRRRVQKHGRAAGSAIRVLEVLKKRPVASIREASAKSGLSFPAASSA